MTVRFTQTKDQGGDHTFEDSCFTNGTGTCGGALPQGNGGPGSQRMGRQKPCSWQWVGGQVLRVSS